MAVFCLAVLLVALGIAAVVSLPQLGEDSVIPEVSVAPDPGIGLGDAVAVPPARQLTVGAARLAGGGGPRLAVAVVAGPGGGSAVQVGVGSAKVAAAAAPVAPPSGAPHSPPAEPVAPQPPPAPVAVPVSAPTPSPVAVDPTRPEPDPGSLPPRPIPSGGPTGDLVWGPVQVYDGDEYAYSFSFFAHPDAYRAPGEDNLVLRVGDETDQSHSFGLQLWDDGSGSQRGLWASGEAMDGERFLAPVAEGAWHQIVLHLQASSEDDGFYMLLLDGEPIDTRAWVSLIDADGGYGLLEAGLFREGERINASPEVVFGPTRLGETLEPVIP